MTRYDFLLYHRDVPTFLERLRELGLVDITVGDFVPTADEAVKIALSERYARVVREMSSVKGEGTPFDSVGEAVDAFEAAQAKIAEMELAITRAGEELERVKMWGEFDPIQIEQLRQQGVVLRFFETSHKAYREQWQENYAIEEISRDASQIRFVVACSADEASQHLDIEAVELSAPASSALQKQNDIERYLVQQAAVQAIKARAATQRDEIKAHSVRLAEEIDFVKVMRSGDDVADNTVKVLEGWSPKTDRAQIEQFAEQQELIFTSQEAKAEQNPPIKLKNSFFARMYEPIGALYLLPRYDELDMTPFFAPFFMLFFGMCFGDAGYGLLLIVAILLLWKKIPVAFRNFAWLGLFLNFAAVIFGTLTGNFFGIELFNLEFLRPYKELFLDSNSVFYLSVIIGAIQVLFGQVLRIFNRIKRGGSFIYGVSSIGWVVLFISSIVAFTGVADPYFSSQSIGYYIALSAAGVMILFFGKPGKNPFINLGSGLYNCYEMATGIAGDLISYVRLFAIGVAGTVIAQVFNELAMGMSGDIPVLSIIIMLVILLIGHGLNIFISILGAFVHPVRLTFVEFYKNSEFEGGGRKFTPFKRRSIPVK